MKKMCVTVWCRASYESEIEVPDELTLDEAIDYAEDHINEIPLTELDYLDFSSELYKESCYFYFDPYEV